GGGPGDGGGGGDGLGGAAPGGLAEMTGFTTGTDSSIARASGRAGAGAGRRPGTSRCRVGRAVTSVARAGGSGVARGSGGSGVAIGSGATGDAAAGASGARGARLRAGSGATGLA